MSRLLLLGLTVFVASGCALKWAPPSHASAVDGATISVPGGWVRAEVSGPRDAPAVVLVHGFGSHLGVWDAVLPALGGLRVLRLDLIGFGESSRQPGDYSPEAQADAILAVMDAAGVDRASVVGHSMGATVALTLAERAPDRVSRLLLLAPWVYDAQIPWSYRDARQPGVGELIVGAWHGDQLAWRLAFSMYDPAFVTESMLESARASTRRPGVRAAALATIRALDLADREARYARVGQPTLVVAGREDRVSTLAFAERLVAQLPDARLETLSYCGHLPMIEAPEITRRLVAAVAWGELP